MRPDASRARCTRARAARSRASLDANARRGGHARDDLAQLEAERDAADRDYNEALTRLDRAIQQLPAGFPHPPPAPDEHQVTPLNTLWKIDTQTPARGWRRGFVAGVRRAVAPLFEQQQAFNSRS